MAVTTITVREQALRNLVAVFRTQTRGLPASDPYDLTWSVVTRQDIGQDRYIGKEYVLGVFDTTEVVSVTKLEQYEKTLRVVLEWAATISKDEDPSEEANRIMGQVQRRIREDPQLTGTVLSIVEVGNEIDIDSPGDRQIGGMLIYEVLYRHKISDPRTYL